MKRLLVFLIVVFFIKSIDGLIFMKRLSDARYPGVCFPIHSRLGKMRKWATIYLRPGEEHQDENVCGTSVCLNAEGDVMVYYCPRTIPSAECNYDDMVNTRIPFPECCWHCVKAAQCHKLMTFAPFPYPPPTPIAPLKHFP